MTDSIPDFQNMTPVERAALAAQLRTRAEEHEKLGEQAQKRLAIAREAAAKAQAEVDDAFDKSYYLRRMAHAVGMYDPTP